MLFDLERGCKLITPEDVKGMDLYKAFESRNDKRTVKSVHRKLHKFLDKNKPSKSSQLVWTRLAKEFGHQSTQPHADITYIEDVIRDTVGDEQFLKLAGTIFMCVIAEREENHWLSAKTAEKETYDHETGKLVAWRGYWINTQFEIPERYRKHTIDDLTTRFNRKR